jgi:flagellar hook assembly protein FlgD
VFDVSGRLVRAFDLEQFSPGEHEVVWKGTDNSGRRVAAGVYIARLDSADGTQRMRIVLVK